MLSQAELRQLLDIHEPPCLSLYMPTHAGGYERQQDDIRLKNLVRRAEQVFGRQGFDRTKANQLLEPIKHLPDDLDVWLHRGNGLAAFSSQEFFRCYTLPLRCPEFTLVQERFHVSPLLPLLHGNRRYFLLALTKESADLYEATRYSLLDRELPEFEPVVVDGNQRSLQYHSHRPPTQGQGRIGEAMYHGQGGPDEREKDDIINFFKRQVEPSVSTSLKGQTAPLVLACVDHLAAIYGDANTYPFLAGAHVSGSPSGFDDHALRERSWEIAAPLLRELERKAFKRYEDLAGTSRTAAQIEPIVRAARTGRVDTLFIREDIALAGRAPSEDDMDEAEQTRSRLHRTALINEAVEQTLLSGGQVLAVDLPPEATMLSAVFRY